MAYAAEISIKWYNRDPIEDAFLFKLICAVAYYVVGMINRGLFSTGSIYVMGIGLFCF